MKNSIVFAILTAATLMACSQATPNTTSPDTNPPDETVREPVTNVPASPNDTSKFVNPTPTDAEAQQIMAKYAYVDPGHAIPADLLKTAIIYYDWNLSSIPNTAYLSVVDFSAYSGTARFHIIDMKTGAVTSTYVAHGTNSDPKATGYATLFSNVVNSDESSLGMYLTAETYQGDHPGESLRLDGLSDTNSNVRARVIVIHGATYVYDKAVKQGRSFGCLALPMDIHDQIIDLLKGGSLIYAGLHSSTAIQPSDEAAYPPLWESVNAQGQQWTSYAYSAVSTYGSRLLQGSSDMGKFCGKYATLNTNQKISFWIFLASAVVKYESNFIPTDRYLETGLGKDPITGLQVYSEGLMQLSYQDALTYPFCNQFDWAVDKTLSPTDPKKTIFDPNKNLTCGLRILNEQVGDHNLIAVKGYWSTLNPGSSHGKIASIEKLTAKIPFCW